MRKRLTPDMARAWVDVDLDAIVRNARSFSALTGAPLLPMVKADGYGLGAVAVARALTVLQPWGFGVATVDEARELFLSGIAEPIVVLSPLVPAMVDLVKKTITARPSISDYGALQAWLEHGGGPFHVEIDTGMNRSGFRWDDAAMLAAAGNLLANATGWEGVYTHFHSAERDPTNCAEQWRRFQLALGVLGRRSALVHAASSAVGAYGATYAADLVRPGIHLYGGFVPGLDTIPVVRLSARVVGVRRLARGDTVGYDATWTAPNATTVVTLGIGYADGLHRSLSNAGAVELLGQRLPIVGRIAMDHTTIDVGDLSVSIGDVATIFGGLVSLDEQAALAGTISYELLTALGSRLPRIYQRVE